MSDYEWEWTPDPIYKLFFLLIIMFFEFTDTPQIEEMMYWNDESIEQFLDEQGDIIGMNIECNELDTNMTV